MTLYQQVIHVVVPSGTKSNLKKLNSYWDILYTITNEQEMQKYLRCDDYQYWCGAYMSPSLANFAIGYQPYMTIDGDGA